jgi:hypothetical protein
MNDKCGLVNAANPCRCAKKTRGFMKADYVDPNPLQFTKGRLASIGDTAPHRLEELESLDRKHAELFREQAFLAPVSIRENRAGISQIAMERREAPALTALRARLSVAATVPRGSCRTQPCKLPSKPCAKVDRTMQSPLYGTLWRLRFTVGLDQSLRANALVESDRGT